MHQRNARFGLWLFAAYLLIYGGFVGLAAFSPATLEATPLAGVNLAIWYGFGLILAALVLDAVGPGPANLQVTGTGAAPGGGPISLQFAPITAVTAR